MTRLEPFLIKFAPALFVLIWSTGWIMGKYSSQVGEPLSFLVIRFICAAFVMAIIIVAMKVKLPRDRITILHALASGVLLHTIYLGGVWWAIKHGLPTPVSGVIAAVQPILTAFLAPLLLNEKISLKQAWGIFFGFLGICIVLLPRFLGVKIDLQTLVFPIIINLLAMVGVTFGTFYQKKYLQNIDLRASAFLQYIGAFLAMLPLALLTESFQIEWNKTAFFTLAWSVLMLSIGAIGLLLFLIKRGEVSRSAALIFLIPPTTALEAFFLFGESLSLLQISGMLVTVFGVFLATRKG